MTIWPWIIAAVIALIAVVGYLLVKRGQRKREAKLTEYFKSMSTEKGVSGGRRKLYD